MDRFCLSCCAPLDTPELKSIGDYCCYCADEKGNLKSREEVTKGIAAWLACWAPKKDGVDFEKRAENYMKAMPAWAE